MRLDDPLVQMMRRVALGNYCGLRCDVCGFLYSEPEDVEARNARLVSHEPRAIRCDACWPKEPQP